MKKIYFLATDLMLICLSSCWVNTFNVGKGAQTNVWVKKWNSYLIDGLVPVKVNDPNVMADGAKDYTVTIKYSFVNGLVSTLTGGLYSPTTTIVTK